MSDTILLLFFFNFQFYFGFITIFYLVFTHDLTWGKVMIICILCIYVFVFFWVIFFLSFFFFDGFSHQRYPMVSQWSLSDRKSAQVFWTHLSILANLNKAVVWMFSTRPLICKSSGLCTNLWMSIPRAPITTGIAVTFLFYNFFISLARSGFLSFFSLSFDFTQWSAERAKSTTWEILFFIYFLFFSKIWSSSRD